MNTFLPGMESGPSEAGIVGMQKTNTSVQCDRCFRIFNSKIGKIIAVFVTNLFHTAQVGGLPSAASDCPSRFGEANADQTRTTPPGLSLRLDQTKMNPSESMMLDGP